MRKFCVCLALLGCSQSLWALEQELDWAGRARYADVAGDASGRALSLLLRATWELRWAERWQAELELDHVSSGWQAHHSDGVRFNGQPLIPDPPGTEINQGFIALDLEPLKLKLGRQRLNFDDQRFIGGNGFWQNEQTFDALAAQHALFSHSRLDYVYIANARRIYGDHSLAEAGSGYGGDNPYAYAGEHEQHSQLLRLEFNEWDYSRLIAFALRINNLDIPEWSNTTLGTSYNLSLKRGAARYRLQLAAAVQERTELAAGVQLPYYLAEATAGISNFELTGRYELLGSRREVAFITPLGSLHDFAGWADEAARHAVDSRGLRDASLGLSWRAAPLRLEAQLHDFHNDSDAAPIGRELDLKLSYKPRRRHQLSLILADFRPDAPRAYAPRLRRVYLDYSFNL